MGVRLYDPATGRFLSVDPVPGSNANPYEYCTADPVNCYDLDGRWSVKKCAESKASSANAWVNKQSARAAGWVATEIATKIGGYKCQYRFDVRVCNGGWLPMYGRGGTTIGTTFLTGKSSSQIERDLIAHEKGHRSQWFRYGLLFAFKYMAADSNPCRNRWERQAGLQLGGYRC